jgi:hypothetical protein
MCFINSVGLGRCQKDVASSSSQTSAWAESLAVKGPEPNGESFNCNYIITALYDICQHSPFLLRVLFFPKFRLILFGFRLKADSPIIYPNVHTFSLLLRPDSSASLREIRPSKFMDRRSDPIKPLEPDLLPLIPSRPTMVRLAEGLKLPRSFRSFAMIFPNILEPYCRFFFRNQILHRQLKETESINLTLPRDRP